jgi:hypothetical protein
MVTKFTNKAGASPVQKILFWTAVDTSVFAYLPPVGPETGWFPISSAQNLQISTGLISLCPECGNAVV